MSPKLDVDLLRQDEAFILDYIRAGKIPQADGKLPEDKKIVETESSTRNLTRNFTHFREGPYTFLREIGKHVIGLNYRSYENYVGKEIYYQGFSEQMKSNVLKNEMLARRIKSLAERSVKESKVWSILDPEAQEQQRKKVEHWLQDVASQLAGDMICKFEHKRILRVAYYIVMQILARAYHQGFHVNAAEIARLKEVATIASNKNQSLIFLPCHRSHIDYICMQAICFRVGISLPTVVAGDNLNFAVIGTALNNLGAMWMRRSFGDDQLYSAVIQAYIDTLLSEGYNFECFIEGGRSRLGKLLPPKFGILKFIFDTVLSRRTEDCWIVPVSTQYDRVIETESYINELLGSEKKKETLAGFVNAREVLSLKMGRVDIRFHEPRSLKDFITSQIERHTEPNQKYPTFEQVAIDPQLRTRILRALGYQVLSDINEVSVVMPTALIGTVLLTLRGRGVGKKELIRRVEWLCVRIRERGGRVADFGKLDISQVVDRGLDVLGDLVGSSGSDGTLLEQTFYAENRFQLSFYRNMVMHLFISDSIIAISMYTKIKQGGGIAEQKVPVKYLYEQTLWLSKLLASEFVYAQQPGGIRANFWQSVQLLRDQGVIELSEDGCLELSTEERQRGREFFDFYCFLLWPFCDGYWIAAVSLFALTPMAADIKEETKSDDKETLWVEVKEFLEMAQLLGKTVFAQGDLSYFEAVNKEVIGSAFNQYEAEGMIIVRRSKSGRLPPTMCLAPDWLPSRYSESDPVSNSFSRASRIRPEGRLWDYVEQISVFRREGKNRRDSASVSVRVLALADDAGRKLKQRRIQTTEEAKYPESDALVTLSRPSRSRYSSTSPPAKL
ncbi:acyltransferase-domain-containing protein [Lipomyces japonicus]|uniref:acyltransferase-domain-containing protein n=1 Tax=Lipomyces japonicus TaxID=56871 RepID=UPI0034CF1CC0